MIKLGWIFSDVKKSPSTPPPPPPHTHTHTYYTHKAVFNFSKLFFANGLLLALRPIFQQFFKYVSKDFRKNFVILLKFNLAMCVGKKKVSKERLDYSLASFFPWTYWNRIGNSVFLNFLRALIRPFRTLVLFWSLFYNWAIDLLQDWSYESSFIAGTFCRKGNNVEERSYRRCAWRWNFSGCQFSSVRIFLFCSPQTLSGLFNQFGRTSVHCLQERPFCFPNFMKL